MKKRLLIALPLMMLLLGACHNNVQNENNEILSVYQVYAANGGTLSYEQWLSTIKGEKGDRGNAILIGTDAPAATLGHDGDSYVDVMNWDFYNKISSGWIKVGNLKGEDGANGQKGNDGKSAYDIAVENGFKGTEAQWLAALNGEQGKSAYDIAVENGFVGTEAEWLASLKGKDGEQATIGKYVTNVTYSGNYVIVHYSDGTSQALNGGGGGGDTIPVSGISVTSDTLELTVGDIRSLSYNIIPSNATNTSVTFSSSNESVATVDKQGNVEAIAAGSSNITITTVDGNKTVTIRLTVVEEDDGKVEPKVWSKETASQYDALMAQNSEKGHLYVHYLRTSAKKVSDYDDWGIWTWQNRPQDKEGSMWGAVGEHSSSIYVASDTRSSNADYLDDFGVIYDINLSSSSLPTSRSFDEATKIGFLIVNLPSTNGNGLWKQDGKANSYIEFDSAWSNQSVQHIYVLENHVDDYKTSAQAFANEYFPDVEEEEVTLSSIQLSNYTTEYEYGDVFSFDGVCTAQYSNGSSKAVTPTTITKPNMQQVGNQEITVQYTENGKTVSANYTIKVYKEITLYVHLDYNSADYDNPYFQKTVRVGNTYNLASEGLVNPTSNPVYDNATFVGWSYQPVIFSDNSLVNINSLTILDGGTYVDLFGIWEA